MRHFTAAVGMVAALLASVGGPPAAEKPGGHEPAAVRGRVHESYWKEIRVETGTGATEDPFHLFGYGFDPDKVVTWLQRGELSGGAGDSAGALIDATTSPMRIDFRTKVAGEVVVTPAIFRFEGAKLVIIEPSGGYQKFRKDGAHPSRPTSFVPTNENGYTRRILVRCLQYDQD